MTVEMLNHCLNSINIAADDHHADLGIHQMGLAIKALATDNKSHLWRPCLICGQPAAGCLFPDCTLFQNCPQVATACGKLRSIVDWACQTATSIHQEITGPATSPTPAPSIANKHCHNRPAFAMAMIKPDLIVRNNPLPDSLLASQ